MRARYHIPAARLAYACGVVHDAKVLVTGASGFLGAELLNSLAAAGARVEAVSRQARVSTHPGVRWWRTDLTQAAEVERLFKVTEPELVFHLASLVTGRRDLELVGPTFQANLATTVNLLVGATAHRCRRVVLAGSMEEPDVAAGESPGSPYAVAKGAASLYARFFRALYATPVVSARIFMVYGPGQRDTQKVVPYSILSALRGEAARLSSGARPVDWIYVGDVVEGLLRLAAAPDLEGETLDLGSGELVTVREVVERIANALDAPPPEIGALPDRPLEPTRRARLERTAARTGWRPRVALDEGLHRTIVWYRGEAAAHKV